MKSVRHAMVEVNGKQVLATITVDVPDLAPADYVDAGMLLSAVGSGQDRVTFVSRHHADKTVRILNNPDLTQIQAPVLKRVA